MQLQVKPGSVVPGKAADPDKAAIAAQACQLVIGKSGAAITANASEGLFYGIETFVQLLTSRKLSLPLGRD